MKPALFASFTRSRGSYVLLGALLALALAVPARAQPVDPWATDPPPEEAPPDDRAPADEAGAPAEEASPENPYSDDQPAARGDAQRDRDPGESSAFDYSDSDQQDEDAAGDDQSGDGEEREEVPVVLPNIFNAPTGRLLTAGLIFSSATVDTGGGVSGELRAGLGDVAEFGIEISDLIRARTTADDDAERIWPYVLATFKMGLAEHQLFENQPAVALGFRKSFSREDGAHTTRAAELYLVATKSLGEKVALHAGGAFWDAELDSIGQDPSYFHDLGWKRQLRPFGGIEIEPLPDAKILLETFWVPEFCYECTRQMKLTPNFAWGVRYEVVDWVLIESGVRVPDIREVNLIDAQIFGQLSFVSRSLTRLMRRNKKTR